MRKQTVKTSRVAAQLEKMFRLLNEHFYNGQLPEVVISLKKTVGAYGHFTCGKVWQAGNERRYEINISSATLNRPMACFHRMRVSFKPLARAVRT